MVERDHLVRKVANDETGAAGPIVVRGIDAHASPCDPAFAVGNASHDAVVDKGPVAFVAIEAIRFRVVGHKEVHPAIGIVVEHGDTERLRRRIIETGRGGHIFKGAVAVIAIESWTLTSVRLGGAVRLVLPVE